MANLIMCRFTGGFWLIVMLVNYRVLRIIAEIILDIAMIWITRGCWLIAMAILAVAKPVISDWMDRRQKNKRRKKHRRS